MDDLNLPAWPQDWVYFADVQDGALALSAGLLLLLLIISFSQTC